MSWMRTMHFASSLTPLWILAIVVIAVLVLSALTGWRSGHTTHFARGYDKTPPASYPGDATMGAMLGLLGLLLAFTFGFSMTRAEARKVTQLEEAAAISTAFLRADLLAEPGRSALRETLRNYAHTRIADESMLTDRGAQAFLDRTIEAQAVLWPTFMAARRPDTPAPIEALVASGITEVLDAHSRRFTAGTDSIPGVTKAMLLACAAATLFFVGNNSALRGRSLSWRTFIFAGVLSLVMIVILDIERPRSGFVRVDPTIMRLTVEDIDAIMAAEGKGSGQ